MRRVVYQNKKKNREWEKNIMGENNSDFGRANNLPNFNANNNYNNPNKKSGNKGFFVNPSSHPPLPYVTSCYTSNYSTARKIYNVHDGLDLPCNNNCINGYNNCNNMNNKPEDIFYTSNFTHTGSENGEEGRGKGEEEGGGIGGRTEKNGNLHNSKHNNYDIITVDDNSDSKLFTFNAVKNKKNLRNAGKRGRNESYEYNNNSFSINRSSSPSSVSSFPLNNEKDRKNENNYADELFVLDTDGCETKEKAILEGERVLNNFIEMNNINDSHNSNIKIDDKSNEIINKEETIKDELKKLEQLLAYDRYKMGLTYYNFSSIPSNHIHHDNLSSSLPSSSLFSSVFLSPESSSNASSSSSTKYSSEDIKVDQLEIQLKHSQWQLQEMNKATWANCLKRDERPPEYIIHCTNRYFYNFNEECKMKEKGGGVGDKENYIGKRQGEDIYSNKTEKEVAINKEIENNNSSTRNYNNKISKINNKNNNNIEKSINILKEEKTEENVDKKRKKEKKIEKKHIIKLTGGRILNEDMLSHFRFMSFFHSLKKNTCFTCAKQSCQRSNNSRLPCKLMRCMNCGMYGHTRRSCRQNDTLIRKMMALQHERSSTRYNWNTKFLHRIRCLRCGRNGHFICGNAPHTSGLSSLALRNNCTYGGDIRSDTHPHFYDAWFVWNENNVKTYTANQQRILTQNCNNNNNINIISSNEYGSSVNAPLRSSYINQHNQIRYAAFF